MGVKTTINYDERFDKVDAQLAKMNMQLNKITTIVIKGFDKVDKELEKKANKEDVN